MNVDSDVLQLELKATAELSNSKVYVKNGGDYSLIDTTTTLNLDPGENTVYVKVVSSSNAERVYKLIITRSNSDENKLLTLNTSIGEISPKFDPEVNEYVIDVPVGTTNITLSGTVSDYATVKGLETYSIVVGENTKFITVTSQSGIVNTYEVKIVRIASNDPTITNIVPSIGKLNPTFVQGTNEYAMEVEGDVKSISFDVTTQDKNAVVAGDGETTLFAGKNIINITSIAEDGITQESVKIEVYKKTDIISFEVEDEIDVPIGDDYQLEIEYNPENTDYKGMTYEVQDSSILTISETGLITPLKIGDTTVKITSTRNLALTKTITIHVINPEIESDTYIINRDTEGSEYIIGMQIGTTVDEFLSNLKNDRETLRVYESTETDIIDNEEILKTRYVVKLVINNTVYDQLIVTLKGDVDGNGYATVTDVTKIRNVVLKKDTFDVIGQAASDIDMNTFITVTDITKVRNFVLKKVTDLNEDLYASLDK